MGRIKDMAIQMQEQQIADAIENSSFGEIQKKIDVDLADLGCDIIKTVGNKIKYIDPLTPEGQEILKNRNNER